MFVNAVDIRIRPVMASGVFVQSKKLAGGGMEMFCSGARHTTGAPAKSSQVENVRPARGLFSMKWNGRSTRADLLASPRSWAWQPKRSAKAAISGTGTISRPVPRSTRHACCRHEPFDRASKVIERIGKKDLAVEALKGGVALEEQHARVSQHGGCGLHRAFLSVRAVR